jgi:hypothetical protein
MQTSPPSVGNNVKLNPLGSAIGSVAYTDGFINLKAVEPSLGLPSGYTLTTPNSVYYFPVFAIGNTYGDSRRFTGNDSLTFVNKNLGYNTKNPTFNVDISGNFCALSAYIPNLSARYIIPANGSNTISFNASSVVFNSDLYLNNNTYINTLTATSIFTEFLSARNKIENNTIINVYQLTGAFVDNNVIIKGSLTSTNVFATSSITTPFVSANSALFSSLTSNYVTINNTLSVASNVHANLLYGQVDIDPFSQLYYNNNNQLSIGATQNYYFAVRPSDSYSTDNTSVPRTINGDWDSNYGQITEDSNVLRPYFKNLQPVFDYIYNNGLVGTNAYIWIDEDIIAGEDKPNFFTTDRSGQYAGCTFTGNITAGYYSTEWLGSNYPSLTAAGLLGGDFIWAKNNIADIQGQYYYLNIPPVDVLNIRICGRYEIGSLTRVDGKKYYSTWKPYNVAPKKLIHRTYVCANSALSYGEFKDSTVAQLSTWNTVTTKSLVQGRPVTFNHKTNLILANLEFEFNTNAVDSTAIIVFDGDTVAQNITISLLGTGIYTYGALILDSEPVVFQAVGSNLLDPIVLSVNNWNTWNQNGYNYTNPNYFPGYGLAIVGNPSVSYPTLVNFGPNTAYTGLINVKNGATFDKLDYGTSREIGRSSALPSSLILDGKFNANALYQLGNNSKIQASEILYKTSNFGLSSKSLKANNYIKDNIKPTYKLEIYDDPNSKVNFKFVDFAGSFSSLSIIDQSYTNWTFSVTEPIIGQYSNSYLNVYNGNAYDSYYIFYPDANVPYIDLYNVLGTTGHLNYMLPSKYNDETTMQYTGIDNILRYDTTNAYTLRSPLLNYGNNNYYTLNFRTSSTR